MMISALLGKIIAGVLYVAIIALFAWLWTKFKKKAVAGGTVGLFVGLIPVVMLVVLPTKVYVVFAPEDYSTYWVYGSSSYTLKDGESVEITSTNLESTVINDSEEYFEIEPVIYGFTSDYPDNLELDPGDDVIIDADITYFFNDEIPDEIEIENGTYAIRYWLRD